MMAPEPVVNYLVAHEVCHLQFMNHSSDFWHLVGSVCPGYENRRPGLRPTDTACSGIDGLVPAEDDHTKAGRALC